MTWAELDSKFPAMKARYDTARSRYILRGTDFARLAAMLELKPEDLARRASEEKWDMLRIEGLRSSAVEAQALIDRAMQEADPDDPLGQHLIGADAALKIGISYLTTLTKADGIQDARLIQTLAMSYKLIVEGIRISIDTARVVRGIANGQPSHTVAASTHEVRLKVVYEDDEKETA